MPHKPRLKYQELPVEAVVHRQDRRANIPTEELRDFVAEEGFPGHTTKVLVQSHR